ncbi:MAG: sigma-70 family RNA polymerase sigma factor [Cyclobacteriaceae bacterium]
MKEYQSQLFPYAYNILGSAEDAKDAVQDVMLKYISKGIQPESEMNYLIKGVINQSINIKRRKRKIQREGSWLPEPVATETADLGLELRELVSYSLLFLLERLNPKERAVFILKEAFAYNHKEIAEVLSITIAGSRKLLSRAHQKVQQTGKPKTVALSTEIWFKTIDRFTRAIHHKDLNELHKLLSEDISFHADGGTKIKVVKNYCSGIDEVADLLLYVHHKYQRNYSIKPALVNYQPALLYSYRSRLMLCQVFELDANLKINRVLVILDPIKLKALKNQ